MNVLIDLAGNDAKWFCGAKSSCCVLQNKTVTENETAHFIGFDAAVGALLL